MSGPEPGRERWRVDRLAHPAAPLLYAVDADDAVVYVSLGARVHGLREHSQKHGASLEVERRADTAVRRELCEYLAGQRRSFTVALRPLGTPFQVQTWQALASIGYGKTLTYGELAALLGCRNAARAVGRANGCNPLSIVLPCHRVIGTSGALVGFGGGLPLKRWLLQLEERGVVPQWNPRTAPAHQLGLFA